MSTNKNKRTRMDHQVKVEPEESFFEDSQIDEDYFYPDIVKRDMDETEDVDDDEDDDDEEPTSELENDELESLTTTQKQYSNKDHLEFVLQQIMKNIYTLSPRRKGRSFVWTILSEIIKDDDSTLKGYLYCRSCKNVIKYSPTQSSNLSRHKCCQSLRDSISQKGFSPLDKEAAIDSCMAWINEDGQEVSAIHGSGFLKLAKFFNYIGAKYGKDVDVNRLLPEATMLSRTTLKLAEVKKQQMKDEIADIVDSGRASATVEIWTDNYAPKNLMAVTLHYEKDLKLFNIILGLESLDLEHSTAAYIFSKLKTLFSEFGINNMKRINFVTDRKSNVVKALETNIRLNSSSHLLVNVLEDSFKDVSDITDLHEMCKEIVKCLKRANLDHQWLTSMENQTPLYWNYNFTGFKSLIDHCLEINKILKEKDASKRLSQSVISTLRQLVDLSNNFEIIFKKLQISESPSLCFVIPSIQKVKHLCLPNESDVHSIILLKGKIIDNVDKIWHSNLSIWQKVAYFLYPPALKMQPGNLNEMKSFCISQICNQYQNASAKEPTSQHSDTQSSGAERSSSSTAQESVLFFFPQLINKSTKDIEKTCADEFDRYCNENVKITKDFDVFKWWKSMEKVYPFLTKFALKIHSIPACSTPDNVIPVIRKKIGPKFVGGTLFLHSYFKHFEN